MKRPAVLVLLLTFVALVASTLYVPVSVTSWSWLTRPPDQRRVWIWEVFAGHGSNPAEASETELSTGEPKTVEQYFQEMVDHTQEHSIVEIRWGRWAVEFLLLLALGGAVALALHTRERRRASLRPPIG